MASPSPLVDFPQHLLEEIFLRLPAAEDLARASATCVTFRRLVTDRHFLRRFRRLHPPPFLAFFDSHRLHPALPPHPSAPAARALALAADFSFSFVPSPHCRRAGRWAVQDIRDGRVLLRHTPFADLAVCDPLHRRYILLPPLPEDLAALVAHPYVVFNPWCQPFLVPLDEDAATTFRVIWVVHCETMAAAIVFSSSTGQWQTAGDLTRLISATGYTLLRRHYAYHCFYWELNPINKLLMLDTRTMEFSFADLPPGEWALNIAIVEAEGRLGMFGIFHETAGDLCYYVKGNKGESSQWQIDKTISIGSGHRHYIKAASKRYLLLGKYVVRRNVSPSVSDSTSILPPLDMPGEECISIDIKTLQLERVCVRSFGFGRYGMHIYTNFPPSLLSAPTI
ncbi:hypothetical protein CFC21_110462 [Triticum aestivum]|uniref:F-box domain-containing protein n=2 Tax=Triticum aestivum TaxID=4565 RepID=A0A9R1NE31_WHEAT|nr:uncharacterized protein LOC123168217 [Triticum aestivum]KAF7110335.1 hypothetical protein CFC21_110462 [Triticum aestivum]